MYPHVTQFETRTMQMDDEIRVRAEREALRRPKRTPGRPALPRRFLSGARTLFETPAWGGRGRKDQIVKHRFLHHVVAALAVGAVAVPLAHATRYDGYKSSYPQLHQVLSGAVADLGGYEGYKSSYPQLHQLLSGAVSDPGSTVDDGYKSSYPQLHAVLAHQVRAPFVPTANGFDWRDAAFGAGTAAVAILLVAGAALLLVRRRVRVPSKTVHAHPRRKASARA